MSFTPQQPVTAAARAKAIGALALQAPPRHKPGQHLPRWRCALAALGVVLAATCGVATAQTVVTNGQVITANSPAVVLNRRAPATLTQRAAAASDPARNVPPVTVHK